MKKILKTVGIFAIAFLIGTGIYYLIPRNEKTNQSAEIIEQPVLPEVAPKKEEAVIELKIFDVKHFFDDEQKFNRIF